MSHFYGRVRGGRSSATRCGHKSTGLRVVAQSLQGDVNVELWHADGVDMAHVCFTSHGYSGRDVTLYSGPISPSDVDLKRAGADLLDLGPLSRQALAAE